MPVSMPKISDNCRIRDYVQSDIPLLAEIEFDSEVKRYVGVPEGSKEQWTNKANLDCLFGWAIEALPDGVLAGRVNLNRAKDRSPGVAEFQIIIGKEFWERKLGREVASIMLPAAFGELNAISVIAEVHPDNIYSLALLQAFDFRYEGKAQKQPMLIYELKRNEISV